MYIVEHLFVCAFEMHGRYNI